MNRKQSKIVGWALIVLGLAMVAGGVLNAFPPYKEIHRDEVAILKDLGIKARDRGLRRLLTEPLFYVGLAVCVAGVVVLAGKKGV